MTGELDGKVAHVVGVLELSAPGGREDRPPIRQANVFHLNAAGEATHVWSLPADAAIADASSSREEVVAQFQAFKQATGGTLQLALNDVFADDTHAVSLVRLTADRPDRPDKHMDEKEANVFHLDDKGRAYEFWGVAQDQGALNSFWTD